MSKEPTYLQDLRIQGTNGELLRFALALGVPKAMRELRERGGPLDSDWAAARAFADTLAEHGDDLLYKSKKKGETARLCLAIRNEVWAAARCHAWASAAPSRPCTPASGPNTAGGRR